MADLKLKPVEGGIRFRTGQIDDNVGGVDGGNQDGGTGGDNGITNPGDVTGGSSAPVKERKKRGPNKGKSQDAQLDLATLKNSLVFMHIIAAGVFGSPELALTGEQADLYASAVSDVMKHYDTSVPAKTLAWMNLAAAAGGIYYQKVIAIGSRPEQPKSRAQMGA